MNGFGICIRSLANSSMNTLSGLVSSIPGAVRIKLPQLALRHLFENLEEEGGFFTERKESDEFYESLWMARKSREV